MFLGRFGRALRTRSLKIASALDACTGGTTWRTYSSGSKRSRPSLPRRLAMSKPVAYRITRNTSTPWDGMLLPSTLAAGCWEERPLGVSSAIIKSVEDKPLLPGQWIDDLPEPLETVEDVKDLFERVDKLKAARLAEAVRKAALS